MLKEMSARFVGYVYPGETLIIEMWKDNNIIIMQTKTKERNTVALRGWCGL